MHEKEHFHKSVCRGLLYNSHQSTKSSVFKRYNNNTTYITNSVLLHTCNFFEEELLSVIHVKGIGGAGGKETASGKLTISVLVSQDVVRDHPQT